MKINLAIGQTNNQLHIESIMKKLILCLALSAFTCALVADDTAKDKSCCPAGKDKTCCPAGKDAKGGADKEKSCDGCKTAKSGDKAKDAPKK